MATKLLDYCSFSELPNGAYFLYQGERYSKSEYMYGITLDGEPAKKSFRGSNVVIPFETDDYQVTVPPEPDDYLVALDY